MANTTEPDLAQLRKQFIRIEQTESNWGYRLLLLLATHPLGEDFTKDGIPDLVRTQDHELTSAHSEQLNQHYSDCESKYRNQ